MVTATLKTGDILTAHTQVLVSTANPGFQLTGGIGALLMRQGGAAFQQELNQIARLRFGSRPAPRGSLLVSGSAGLPYQAILHVVAIDVFYKTNRETLVGCMADTLREVDQLGAQSVAVPAFATGYGRFPLKGCASAMREGFQQATAGLKNLRAVEVWIKSDLQMAEFKEGWEGEKA
jgi:O-acetyl-ADP-ribose deacetylase (regulator of RNase III)